MTDDRLKRLREIEELNEDYFFCDNPNSEPKEYVEWLISQLRQEIEAHEKTKEELEYKANHAKGMEYSYKQLRNKFDQLQSQLKLELEINSIAEKALENIDEYAPSILNHLADLHPPEDKPIIAHAKKHATHFAEQVNVWSCQALKAIAEKRKTEGE